MSHSLLFTFFPYETTTKKKIFGQTEFVEKARTNEKILTSNDGIVGQSQESCTKLLPDIYFSILTVAHTVQHTYEY